MTLALLFLFCSGVQASSANPAEILRTVRQLIQQGEIGNARERLLRALKQYPAEANFHNLLGVIEAQQGNYVPAEASFLQAIKLAPKSPGTYLNLGRLYQENSAKDSQAPRKALDTYRKLLSYYPDDVEAHYQCAVLLHQQRDSRASLSHLDRLKPEAQQRAQALALRCANYVALADFSRAKEAADHLIGSKDLSEPDIQSVLPVLETSGSIDAADLQERLLQGLVDRQLASASSLQKLAALYDSSSRLVPARETLERVAMLTGPSTDLLLQLARVANKQGDYEGALGYLAHARDLSPDNAGTHFFFGMVCVELNLGTEAYQSLSRAVRLEPDNPYYNYAMGAVSLDRRDPSEAIPYFRKYRELKPEDPRGRLMLGIAFVESVDLTSARKELEEAAHHGETAAAAYFYLARLNRQEEKLPEGLNAVNKSLELDAANAEVYAELGLIRFRRGEYDLAEKALARALELNPDNYPANFNLLMLYRRTADKRAEAQAKRFDEVKDKRTQKTQEFLRLIEIRP